MIQKSQKYILSFREISKKDVPLVGGKNASLGEMIGELSSKGINIPDGFATTSYAYWYFLEKNKILPKLKKIFNKLDVKNIKSLQKIGKEARSLILKAEFPEDLKKEIIKAYRELGKKYSKNPDVAVRSSATAEDLPSASFAGLHETYLNVKGEKELPEAVKKCIASLFNDRAISYREEKGFNHFKIALSVGVQKMVRSDLASAGIIFTLDTETGFSNVVLINSIWGVGEMIVKGKITPDQFYVFKPTLQRVRGKLYKPIIVKNLGRKTKKYIYGKKGGLREVSVPENQQLKFSLTDKEVLALARWSCLIENHYKIPQDIEWAKDGKTNQLFIVQSRPETVHTPSFYGVKTKRRDETKSQRTPQFGGFYQEYEIKTEKKPVLTGTAIGDKIGIGKVQLIPNISKIGEFQEGGVLVTRMTDPDWVSIFPQTSAIITEEGGKTCHAAIVSRELGVPCIVGAKGATKKLKTGKTVTVDCTQGLNGRIFLGKIPFKIKRYNLKKIPRLKTKIMVNIGAPEIAFKTSFLPHNGVGLARIEFILADKIRIHPLALCRFKKIKDKLLKKKIEEVTVGYKDKKRYFVEKLAEGVSQIAAAFYPEPVIVRFSDFKTNEYASLIGGKQFEPEEANPMLGWRGAARYYDPQFKEAFLLECQALKRAREKFGLKNIWAMIPFCRTVEEGRKVLKTMREGGLEKGKDGLKVIAMCEIPSNIILAKEFLEIFDGMSIGSNDLTQLVLGIDRDNAQIAHIGDERNKAVKNMIREIIKLCQKKKKYCGICGDAPSTFPDFAEFLIEQGIESISLNPDTVIKTTIEIAKKEKQLKGREK